MILLLALASPSVAHAQQRDQREVHAQELFALGRYADALAIYGKLYAETNHPTYLRNIGRCYQNMGEPDKAIASFREYLRHAKALPADQRALIDGYVREMQDLKAKRLAEEEAARPPPRPKEPEPALKAPPPDVALPPIVAQPAYPPVVDGDEGALASDRGGRRTAAYVVSGASLISLGVGAFFGVQAIRNESSSKNLCTGTSCGSDSVSLNNSARTDARIADFTIGGGLLAAGVATYLFLRSDAPAAGAPGDSAANRLHVEPRFEGDRVGLAASGTW